MKNVVITGGTSSIGIPTIALCIKNGINVYALVRKNSPYISSIPKSPNVNLIYCDLKNIKDSVNSINVKCDVFFHFAWEVTKYNSDKDYNHESHYNNIQYAIDCVYTANALGCGKFINSGSQAEYGLQSAVITPLTETNPLTHYGKAKLDSSKEIRRLCRDLDIIHIWTRIFSAYGAHDNKPTLVNYVIDSILNNQKLQLTKCEQIWNYIYTDDVALALYLMAEKSCEENTYCVGGNECKPLKEYVNEIKDIINPDFTVEFGAVEYTNSQLMNLKVDISKLKQELNFEQSVSFEQGIRQTLAWRLNKKMQACN